jgi:hypothetical protein
MFDEGIVVAESIAADGNKEDKEEADEDGDNSDVDDGTEE